MADNVMMGLHIRRDSPDGAWYLKTDKIYQWQITSETTGKPKPGNVAIVKTKFGNLPVLIYATKEIKNDVKALQPVIRFESHPSKNKKINQAFSKFSKQA